MHRTIFLLLAVASLSIAQELKATVLLCPDPDYRSYNTNGVLELVQSGPNAPVKITGWVAGLRKNALHGFHVHEKGNITSCKSTGGHYNPDGKTHGAQQETERHAGDLGNIRSDAQGRAEINISDNFFSLTGPRSVLGRAFVVHALEDDLGKGGHKLSKTTGNAGDRWSCGVIGLA